MRKFISGLFVVTIISSLLLISGCARRNDPVGVFVGGKQGTIASVLHDYQSLGLLPANGDGLTLTEFPKRTSKTYRPPGYRVTGQGRPYPVLYLLLDFGGNATTKDVTDQYYFEIGLQRLADSLINAGIIKPMIIATVDLHNAYGGSWYTSNPVQGLYDACLTEFVAYTDTALNTSTQNGKFSRAVAGVGMGGYGAIISSMRHPGLFVSASSVNGHLAFTGESNEHNFHGVTDWAPMVFEENRVTVMTGSGPFTDAAVLPYYSIAPDITRPLAKPFTNLVFSMAAAFSPYNPATATSLDSMTWMNKAVAGGVETNWKVTLPFDFSGNIWPSSWAEWKNNDPSQILYDNPVALSEVQVLVMAGTSGRFNTLAQNRIFKDVVVQRGAATVDYREYDGYGDYETAGRNYLIFVLRDVLKFHSDNFTRDPFTLE
jgi:S-formylglutathione hydrolase FrmB